MSELTADEVAMLRLLLQQHKAGQGEDGRLTRIERKVDSFSEQIGKLIALEQQVITLFKRIEEQRSTTESIRHEILDHISALTGEVRKMHDSQISHSFMFRMIDRLASAATGALAYYVVSRLKLGG